LVSSILFLFVFWYFLVVYVVYAFSALTLLVGRQKGSGL